MQHRDTAKTHPNSGKKTDIIIWIIMVVLLILLAVKISSTHGSFAFSGQAQRAPLITECMPSNSRTITNENGTYCDWIELYNPTAQSINLAGFCITDDPEIPDKYELPYWNLSPGGYALIYADDQPSTDTELHAPFKLNDKGEMLILFSPEGTEVQRIGFPKLERNISYALDTDTSVWEPTDRCTPGFSNTDDGYAAYRQTRGADSPVMINEIMASNTITLCDKDGDYPDWVELWNPSAETVDLTGWGLSDTTSNPKRWEFPPTIIGPGEYMIVFLSGKNRSTAGEELHTNFKLNASKDTLLLSNLRGKVINEVQISDLESDHSYGLIPGTDTCQVLVRPTPYYPNNEEGWSAFRPRLYTSLDTPVVISEIMSNDTVTRVGNSEEYRDWIELYNRSDEAVDLTGWGLTNQTGTPGRWRLTACVLGPGEYLNVNATGQNCANVSETIHTDFRLGSEGDIIVLTNGENQVADFCFVPPLRIGVTYQREPYNPCFMYCDQPTPGAANAVGYSDIAAVPVYSLKAGMYSSPQQVELLSSEPDTRIYYTLDGADPGEDSIPYTRPIYMDETTVIRAVACRDGYLPSNAACATYLIGEDIHIPVASVVTDPANLYDEKTGIYADGPGWTSEFPHLGSNYWQDWERPAHVELLEPDGTVGISQDIGVKIFGSATRARPQKPLALIARDRYGHDSFDYRVFPELPYENYKALILRNGQDANYSHIRDKLQVDLALEASHVDGQAHRQCIVFLNGEYWGLYDLAEKVNEHFLAQHHEVDPDKIDLLWGNGEVIIGDNKDYLALIEYVKSHDLSVQKYYNYVASQIDIDNYIDWCAIQIYIAHEDTDGNTKFWRSQTPGGRWRWILYDLDYGFWHLYQPEYAERLDAFSMFLHPKGNGNAHRGDNTLIRGLLQNEAFRQKFIKRFVYHCTVTFEPGKVLTRIDKLSANIKPYIQRDKDRWPGLIVGGSEIWQREHLQLLKDFAMERPGINLYYMQRYFKLSDAEMERLLSN